MDLLFSSDSVFAWRAERDYANLLTREENIEAIKAG